MTAKEILNSNDIYKYDRVWIDGCPETSLVGIDTDIIIQRIKEYTRLKCLEAIENTKNRVCEELESLVWPFSCDSKILNYPPTQLIKNIPDQDVMPEL